MFRAASMLPVNLRAFFPSPTAALRLRPRAFGRPNIAKAPSVILQLRWNSSVTEPTSTVSGGTLGTRAVAPTLPTQYTHQPKPVGQVTEPRGDEPSPHPRYDAPSPELVAKLTELSKDEAVVDETVRDKVLQALEMAPTVAVIHNVPRLPMREHVVSFRRLINDIDSFLDEPLGRIDDVLLFRSEIIQIQRALSFDTPAGSYSNSNLAHYHRNLALALHKNEQYAEACAQDEEALAIRRRCYQARPGEERPLLTLTLYTYSKHLEAAQRYDDALKVAQELLPIQRLLHELDPVQYRSSLADALSHIGVLFSSTQRFEDAKTAEEEALVFWRTMYDEDPERYQSVLIHSLGNYIITLRDLGLPKELRAAQAELEDLRAQTREIPTSSSLPFDDPTAHSPRTRSQLRRY
ncbi:hypothetical protein DL93DRAFT_1954573 [Clavulina sp. PMI_390]|nr:hypothetical protein DL93DRAFT_1954573 [Clavulina sp. PMI_390]